MLAPTKHSVLYGKSPGHTAADHAGIVVPNDGAC